MKSSAPRVRFLLLLLFALGFVAGCGDEPDEHSDETISFDADSITLAVPEGFGFENTWKSTLDEWAAMTGVETDVVAYSAGADLDASIPAKADLILFPIAGAAQLQAAGRLAPIPETLESENHLDWVDLFRGLREQVGKVGGRPFVVPVCSPALVCYYRKDLLEAAGLEPPETWDDYQKLLESRGSWASGLSVVEPWCEEFRATLFLARALPWCKHPGSLSVFFDLAEGEPLIDGPGFVRALELSKQAVNAAGHAGTLNLTPAECRRALLEGKAAIGLTFETGPGNPPFPFAPAPASNSESQPVSVRADKIELGFCPLPGTRQVYNRTIAEWQPTRDVDANRATLTAFAGLACGVSPQTPSEHQRAAWDLLAELAVQGVAGNFPGPAKSLCRESQLGVAATWTADDLSAAERGRYVGALAQSLRNENLVSELPILGRDKFRDDLTAGLTRFLTTDASAQDVLGEVAAQWNKRLDQIGRQDVLNSYRISLGRPANASHAKR